MSFYNNNKEIIVFYDSFTLLSNSISCNFITFANRLKSLNMKNKDLNRLKLVLVEKKRTGT